ncbi:hypothetical protein E5288_WYG005035 [Bos mutus]|uniref:PR domain zinc finger protein 16 n=1 Tax=Bos mutus TaxID=72004 RepID=A0A6B0QV71_9CETA|nr:hypothetical protein [Bos mutus]
MLCSGPKCVLKPSKGTEKNSCPYQAERSSACEMLAQSRPWSWLQSPCAAPSSSPRQGDGDIVNNMYGPDPDLLAGESAEDETEDSIMSPIPMGPPSPFPTPKEGSPYEAPVYIPEDIRIPPGFELRESSIPGAGLGIWAKKKMEVGERFGPYMVAPRATLNEADFGWEMQASVCSNFKETACITATPGAGPGTGRAVIYPAPVDFAILFVLVDKATSTTTARTAIPQDSERKCPSSRRNTSSDQRIISSLRIWALSALTSPVDGPAAPEQRERKAGPSSPFRHSRRCGLQEPVQAHTWSCDPVWMLVPETYQPAAPGVRAGFVAPALFPLPTTLSGTAGPGFSARGLVRATELLMVALENPLTPMDLGPAIALSCVDRTGLSGEH